MADSIRKQLLRAVKLRLSMITVGNDFTTDAGLHIFLGVLPVLGPDDPPAAIALVPQDFSPVFQARHVVCEWPIDIVAVANASMNLDEPWLLVEDVLADIQRAMELESNRTFGGLLNRHDCCQVGTARTFERESASEVVAVSQTYVFQLSRVFGNPDVAR